MSPGGYWDYNNSALIWVVNHNGQLWGDYNLNRENVYILLRPVINLKADVVVTKDDTTGHYIVN